MKNGVRKILKENNELTIGNHTVEQKPHDEATRTLGVWFSPNLCWDKQYEIMKEKLIKAMIKLLNTKLYPYMVHIYFNVYMIKSVYFGCGVISLTTSQINELKKIYEEPILIKLGLTKKFPREVMYMSKDSLGLGLLTPETILAIQRLKLYFG